MTPEQLDIYLSGVFDGEGCVTVTIVNNRLRLGLTVSMCDREAVDLFCFRFGGLFSDNRKTVKTQRTIYRWRIGNGMTLEALEVFSKWCQVKKKVVDLALPMALSMRSNTGNNISYIEKTKRLLAAQQIVGLNGGGHTNQKVIQPDVVGKWLGDKRVIVHGVGIFENRAQAAKALGRYQSAVSGAIERGGRCAGYKIGVVYGH